MSATARSTASAIERLKELARSPAGSVDSVGSIGSIGNPMLDALGGTEEPEPSPIETPAIPSYKPARAGRGRTSSTEERALALLGSGIAVESVASALGVTPSRISQLMADTDFANEVATLRYNNLQKHNVRDNAYDQLEDRLLDKMNRLLPLMLKPTDVLRALQTVNNAKRRGQSAPDQVINSQTIVNLTLPTIIANTYAVQTNVDNQVIKAGEQELLTMPSGELLDRAERIERIEQVKQGGLLENL